jgi:hypothetical protein
MGKQRCDGALTTCGYVKKIVILMFMLYLDYQSNDVIVKVSATSSSCTTDWISIGPIQLVPPSSERKSFCWTARVDKKKGIAFSRETSNVANDKSNKNLNRQDRSLKCIRHGCVKEVFLLDCSRPFPKRNGSDVRTKSLHD